MKRVMLILASLALAYRADAAPAACEGLVEAARAQLLAMSDGVEGRLAFIAQESRDRPIAAMSGCTSIQARRPHGEWPRRRVGVPVKLTSEGAVTTRMVWFMVQWWQQRPVYAQPYAKGTQGENVALFDQEIDALAGSAATAARAMRGPLLGLQLGRSVARGQPARAGDFVAAPLIARHQQVALHLRQGAVALSLPAQAMSEGELGQRIQVMPKGSSTSLRAKVTAANEVSIEH